MGAEGEGSKLTQVPAADQVTVPHQHKRRKIKLRTKAILTGLAEGKTFAEVLGQNRSNVSSTGTGVNVKALRKTQSGGVLLKLEPGTENKAKFSDDL